MTDGYWDKPDAAGVALSDSSGSGAAFEGPSGEWQLRRAQRTRVALGSVGTRFSPSTDAGPPPRRATLRPCATAAARGGPRARAPAPASAPTTTARIKGVLPDAPRGMTQVVAVMIKACQFASQILSAPCPKMSPSPWVTLGSRIGISALTGGDDGSTMCCR